MQPNLTQLTEKDISTIREIECAAQSYPWGKQQFECCFSMKGHIGWLSQCDHQPIGFILTLLQHNECHILNIGVRPDKQRLGVGTQLLSHALSYATQQGKHESYLEVRVSNDAAIALYKKFNFEQIAERKHYYPNENCKETALIFLKRWST